MGCERETGLGRWIREGDWVGEGVFSAKWLFKVICLDVDEKPLGLHTQM